MNLRQLVSRQTISNLLRINGRLPSQYYRCVYRNVVTITDPVSHPFRSPDIHGHKPFESPNCPQRSPCFSRRIHCTSGTKMSNSGGEPKFLSEESDAADGTMNEFLSRFVWIMRSKLSEVYPDSDKQTIDGMLLIIVEKVASEVEKGGLDQMLGASAATPSQDFSEDLWKTVWEVSNKVLYDMKKERRKEKMKQFLQCEEVQEMCRFAAEIGIRGDMLRELRFKWAHEKMEESEFHSSLERMRAEARAQEAGEKQVESLDNKASEAEEKPKVVTLPKRQGKIRYKIYGLDLSDPKWAEVSDKINERGEVIWPQEPKPISGKCKLVTERILSLNEEDDPSPMLAEWVELLQPSRIDWITLLDRIKEKNSSLYFKVAELVLGEESFQTNIRDYSKLIDAHAKENRIEDAERILKKMNDSGVVPDILTTTALVHMYSRAGSLDHAKAAFETLKSQGFQPDMKAYNSMIMAYVKAGQTKECESLMREMEAKDIKSTQEIYMALLNSFAQCGDVQGAARIVTAMQFASFPPTLESCTLLVEAYGRAGDPDQARSNFDYMIKIGHKPDDRCTASMIAAYEKKNLLDKALNLLLQLEKDGFEPGVATYTVLVVWLGKLQLVNEAEQLLGKIAEKGEVPPFKIHVSLCEMYLRAGVEKKALQSLGVLESKKEELGPADFERIINGLMDGGFAQDARRLHGLMEAQGFSASEELKLRLIAPEALSRKRPTMRSSHPQ